MKLSNQNDQIGSANRPFIVREVVAIILGIVAVGYLGAATYMYAAQSSFLYKLEGTLETPEEKGLEGVDVEMVTMRDGKLTTVWKKTAVNKSLPTILYFHGNSGTIGRRADRFEQILASGYGMYVPVIRGFPGSEGEPSEEAIIADALEHFDRVDVDDSKIVVYGESLGTGIATAVAVSRDARALILEAPFTATEDRAQELYPWLPVKLLMRDKYLTKERIKEVDEPVLVIHGTKDNVMPVQHGEKVFKLANEPKELSIVEGANHGNLWDNGLWDTVKEFLKNLSTG